MKQNRAKNESKKGNERKMEGKEKDERKILRLYSQFKSIFTENTRR